MKKFIIKLTIFIMLVLPITVFAVDEGISNYYIEATVLENGSLHVKELFVLDGKFNGYEREIQYSNPNLPIFNGSLESFNGNNLHNASGIKLLNIKSVKVDRNTNFNDLFKDGSKFEEVSFAEKGEHGKYTVSSSAIGKKYTIYNPSNSGERGFYIEYIVENIAITHNDLGEIYWNIFSDLQLENINNLEMYINIPKNLNEVRIWAHGPLHGETEIISKNKLKLYIKDLDKKEPMDVRFVFDKSVIPMSNKFSNIDVLNKIVEVETEKADIANKKREEIRVATIKELARIKKMSNVLDVVRIVWIIGLFFVIRKTYLKYDKEYESTFKTKYYRDFPADYGPAIVSYLIKKKIDTNDMSASILNLIAEKKISYEEVSKGKYEFINKLIQEEYESLTEADKALTNLLFTDIGVDNRVTIEDINKYSKKHYQKFLNSHDRWKTLSQLEAEKENFYEENNSARAKTFLYSVIGIFLSLILINYTNHMLMIAIPLMLSIIAMIYTMSFIKRTQKGNDHFRKWLGLKAFIQDFGKFEARELPHINLWEKYLVYAVVFNCADKLSKQMRIKFKELPNATYTTGDLIFDAYYLNRLNTLNRSLTRGVNNAYSTANSARAAEAAKAISNSSNSSGGGFGGGFSGGGGFGGGGGGGGRF